jgi:hypothetical protein
LFNYVLKISPHLLSILLLKAARVYRRSVESTVYFNSHVDGFCWTMWSDKVEIEGTDDNLSIAIYPVVYL